MEPFEVLVPDRERALPMPGELRRLYGDFPLTSPLLVANFVQSVDGVVAVSERVSSGSLISGHNDADRFLMALLRASAEAVLIGAGTMRATQGHRWTAEGLHPEATPALLELRRGLGLPPEPLLVVLTGSGDIDLGHRGFQGPSLILTTKAGAERLGAEGAGGGAARRTVASSVSSPTASGGPPSGTSPPPAVEIQVIGEGAQVHVRDALEAVRSRGIGRILSEAGARVTGQLIDAGLVDELFLTMSPLLAGRPSGRGRPSLTDGLALLPDRALWLQLRSLRRHGEHLFLRYAFPH